VTLCRHPTMPTLVLVAFDQESEQGVGQGHCRESLGAGCSPLGSLPPTPPASDGHRGVHRVLPEWYRPERIVTIASIRSCLPNTTRVQGQYHLKPQWEVTIVFTTPRCCRHSRRLFHGIAKATSIAASGVASTPGSQNQKPASSGTALIGD